MKADWGRRVMAAGLAAALLAGPLPTAAADPLSPQELLALGRADYLSQQGHWDAAAAELGRLPKPSQQQPAVRQYLSRTLGRLHAAPPPTTTPAGAEPAPGTAATTDWRHPRVVTQARFTHRHYDSAQRSDPSFDDLGSQYNTQGLLEADAAGWRHTVRAAVDGIQDDVNDLRPRHVSYQARRDGVRITTGDVRSYLTTHRTSGFTDTEYTGYTLNSIRVRGMDVELASDRNDLHLLAGVTPYYLSPSDEYIYPRQVYGVRDRYRVTPWYRTGFGTAYARDQDERIEHVDAAIQPREFSVLSWEQDLTVIPRHWTINSESAYSDTDDNLRPNRFGDNVKLKDWAHHVTSEWRWSALRVVGSYERIGPQFRAPTNIGSSGVNSTSVSPDREQILWRIYPRRAGRLFGHFLYGSTRNNVAHASDVEMTREEWFTAQGGLELPRGWPQPDARATLTRTVSVPGNRFSAAKHWLYDLEGSLRKRWWDVEWVGGYDYWQIANDGGTGFDNEYRRAWSLEASRQLWPGSYVSTRGAWTRAQDRFNNATTLRRHTEQEASVTASQRLWSTASLSLGYTYQDRGAGFVVDPSQTAAGGVLDTFSASFLWPYRRALRPGCTLELLPSLHYHFTDASDNLERHAVFGTRLTARYTVRDAFRWELALEHRADDDAELSNVKSEEWRVWLALTSKFGPRLTDESAFR